MKRRVLKWLAVAAGIAHTISPDQADAAMGKIGFNHDIRPILSANCFACHGPDSDTRKAGLRLDTRDGLFGESRNGTAVVAPGDAGKSDLFARLIHSNPEEKMPPPDSKKRLTPLQIETISIWIHQGAPWQGHWVYVPPKKIAPPDTSDAKWARNAIDRFILTRLEKEGLSPSPPTDKRTLLRRLHFDLAGLPPTSEDVEPFVASENSDAYEKAVDRLLDSRHFGERMAVHWLDLVRYADTVGYHGDQEMNISPYRDYVIRAFNENMPFDQFTIEQLAGDLLPDPTMWQKVASGFNRLNMTTEEGGAQPGEYLTKYAADRVRAVGTVWMAASLGCAECHNHKYDPYTQKDFYSLAAFFADIQEVGKYAGRNGRPPEMLVPTPKEADKLKELDARIAELQEHTESMKKKLSDIPVEGELKLALRLKPEKRNKDDQKTVAAFYQKHSPELGGLQRELDKRMNERKDLKARVRRTLISASVKPRTMRVLPRGNWMDKSGAVVHPETPDFLTANAESSNRRTRLDLARWFVSRDNPQTARAFVNRLWKLFFGTGIAKSLDDLGSQGELPAHPELLDWLAVEFMDSGWDIKHMIKLLVMSSTYRQTSVASPELAKLDPYNRLLARQSRWRLEAEFIRDNALAISGLLIDKLGGFPAKPYQPAGYYKHLNFPTRKYKQDNDENQYRRGVYTHWQRTYLHPSLLAFDAPSREECVAERPISNTPSAALALLNDPSHVEAARAFAQRILSEGGTKTVERLKWTFLQALSRPPTDREINVLNELLETQTKDFVKDKKAAAAALETGLSKISQQLDSVELAAWTSIARAILNLNETITRN